MSDKMQHTAASMREKMLNRYGDEFHHKHNKCHSPYRLHFRTHPCIKNNKLDEESISNGLSALNKKFKLRKLRKRLDKGRIH